MRLIVAPTTRHPAALACAPFQFRPGAVLYNARSGAALRNVIVF
jgi:hypothetical protein